jgi:hypothetical protein
LADHSTAGQKYEARPVNLLGDFGGGKSRFESRKSKSGDLTSDP